MRLRHTRRHWNKLAQSDPLWAVLTSPDKKGNRWQIDEFFADGRNTIATAVQYLNEHAPGWRRGSALDFGCGVGRLTQGLALHFDRVTGVDISEEMLAHARRYNQQGDRVNYVHNARADLRQFAGDQFDLVYSLITLQHMEGRYARTYIREFVRIAAPAGLILFQIPTVGLPDKPDSTLLTLWPPTFFKRLRRRLARLRNTWFAAAPRMEMHGLPPAEVLDLLAQSGAEVVHANRSDVTGEVESWVYLARKR